MVAVKISILLQYITLFVAHRGTNFHYFVQGLIWTNIFYYTIITLLYLFEVSKTIFHPLVVKSEKTKGC